MVCSMRIRWWRREPRERVATYPRRLADGNEVPLPGYRTYRELLTEPVRPRPGGWCDRCVTLFATADATMCHACGGALRPVRYTIEGAGPPHQRQRQNRRW
jgi:hypothetical protein